MYGILATGKNLCATKRAMVAMALTPWMQGISSEVPEAVSLLTVRYNENTVNIPSEIKEENFNIILSGNYKRLVKIWAKRLVKPRCRCPSLNIISIILKALDHIPY